MDEGALAFCALSVTLRVPPPPEWEALGNFPIGSTLASPFGGGGANGVSDGEGIPHFALRIPHFPRRILFFVQYFVLLFGE